MAEMAACVRCGQRFFVGFRTVEPTCGVCAPREPQIEWSRIPRRATTSEGQMDSAAQGSTFDEGQAPL